MSKEVHRIYFCKDGAILDTQIREGEDVTDTLKRCFKKISDLEAKLAEKEHIINTLIEDHKASQEWYKMQLADTEAQNKRVLEKLDIIVRSNQELEQKLAESEKKHLLDEKEWQEYCAYKHIEPQIKGCLDREKELKQQLAEKDEEITQRLVIQERDYNQDKISFCIEQLEKVKEEIGNKIDTFIDYYGDICIEAGDLEFFIDKQIKQLKEMK